MIISHWILLRIRNVSDQLSKRNQNTHIMSSNFFFRKLCRIWHNVEIYGRSWQATYDNIIQRLCFACWISKTTDTSLEYVIFIACARRIWLSERVCILRSYVYCVPCIAIYTIYLSSSGDELAQPVEWQRCSLDDWVRIVSWQEQVYLRKLQSGCGGPQILQFNTYQWLFNRR